MKIIKPIWASHSSAPIFSCDIFGHRIVTGGQDNKIKIWNLRAVEEGKDEALDGLLCCLDAHTGVVNCVRWSPDGKYLASGSDDGLIMLWDCAGSQPSKVFGSTETNLETWRSLGRLIGHGSDVVDLCWSPDGKYLASCSLNRTIIIWNLEKKDIFKKLEGHESTIKGVAWDPLGRYLASQSEDKTVRIWRTMDWSLEAKIEKPFTKIVADTFFFRLGWSPDGGYLATTGTYNKSQPNSFVLKRGDWSVHCDFIGHVKPIVVTRWNPKAFRKSDHDPPYCICAIASQDCGISLWKSGEKRAMLIVHEIFEQSVLDLAWSSDGYTLISCSSDGTLASFFFNSEELGTSVPNHEFESMLRKKYGEILNAPKILSLAESPYQLGELNRQNNHLANNTNDNNNNNNFEKDTLISPSRSITPTQLISQPSQQQQQKLSDGRKRIRPQLLEVVQLTPDDNATIPISPISSFNNIAPPSPEKIQESELEEKQKEKNKEEKKDEEKKKEKRKLEDQEQTKTSKKHKKNKDKSSSKEKDKEKSKSSSEKKKKDSFETTNVSSLQPTSIVSTHLLPEPNSSRKLFHQVIDINLFTKTEFSIEVRIEDGSESRGPTSSIACYADKILWQDQIQGRATILTGNINFIAFTCQGGYLYIYSRVGRRLFPCITLESSLAYLECSDKDYLLAISITGKVYVWNITQGSCILECSLGFLLSPETTIKKVQVSEKGLPLISLTNSKSYTFHPGLKVWLILSDDQFPNSEFRSSIFISSSKQSGILFQIQNADRQRWRPESFVRSNSNSSQKELETIAHLEHQVASALVLESSDEYKKWLKDYVQRLTDQENELKLHEICTFLLGPLSSLHDGNWNPLILDIPKRTLLQELFPIMNSNRALQKLVNQFRENLKDVSQQVSS